MTPLKKKAILFPMNLKRDRVYFAVFFGVALLAALIDIHTKNIAQQKLDWRINKHLPPEELRIDVIPGWLGYRYTTNPGIIFGLGRGAAPVFYWISILAMPIITGIFVVMKKRTLTLTIALAFILGGTIGNSWDRVFHGRQVRDFIDFYKINWPIFNLADSFILVGTILLMLELILFEEKKRKVEDAPAQPGPSQP